MLRIAILLAALLGFAGAAHAQPERPVSRITAVEVTSVAPDGTHGGVAYVRIAGTVRGVADLREAVVGIGALPRNADDLVEYASGFEIIAPAEGQPANEAVYVDVENRGSAISQGALGGFLQNHAVTYARVQWQTGVSPGVPESAQGLGLVILRDFGRWLGGKAPAPGVTGGFVPPAHAKLMIGGISQSAWTVNTLLAEGFNVDPVTRRGVYDAALAVNGIGTWLAINQMAIRAAIHPRPYMEPNGRPLTRTELLTRAETDPLYVDIATYTDFYRLRAGITSQAFTGPKFRRYDLPAPHAAGSGQSGPQCNDGVRIPTSTLRYAPYMRAIVLGMLKEIGVSSAKDGPALPPSRTFTLAADEPPASPGFNPLPGVRTPVPAVDADAWPLGGVRFPEADHPLGRPVPPAVPPAVTTSIAQTCGNAMGMQPFTLAEATARHGSKEGWLARYSAAVDRLIGEGFLLAEDKAAMLEAAARQWPGT